MASDWKDITIEEIAQKIAMGPFGSDIKTSNFVPSGVPIIRGGNLTSGRFHANGFVFLTEEKADQLANANAFPGDLVFTHRGTLSQVGLIPDGDIKRYVVSQSQMKLTCKPHLADPVFIFYFFKSSIGQHELLMNTSQTGVPAISRPTTSLKSIRLQLPPLPEQRAIAHILGTLDDKIELNRRMNETLEAMARALFTSWFVDFDPVRAKMEGRPPTGMSAEVAALFPDGFEESPLGKVPRGWETSPLAEFCSKFTDGSHFSPKASGGEKVIATVKDMSRFDFLWDQMKKISLTDYKYLVSNGCKAEKGDVLFSKDGTIGRVILFDSERDLVLLSSIAILRPMTKALSYYLWAFLLRPETIYVIKSGYVSGSALPRVVLKDLKRLPVILPGRSVLDKFADQVQPIQARISSSEEESQTLSQLRDTLLPKLLSGQLRIQDAEKFVALRNWVMASEWKDITIEEIAQKIAMGPFGSDIKTSNFVPSGVPIIRGGNLTSGRFHANGFVFLTEEKADQLANANAFPGDLVFTHRGTLGQVGLIPDGNIKRYVVSQSQMKLTCKPHLADPTFIFYFFKSPVGQHELLMNTSQTGVPAISRPTTSLKSIRLKLPPLSEQRAIAHILGTLDDKIELNRRMNETLEAMARALFTSWFVDFDPVRAKMEGRPPTGMSAEVAALFPDGFEESPLGKVPRGWVVVQLDDLLLLQRGFDLAKPKRRPGPYPVFAAGGINGYHAEYMVKGPGVTTGRSGVLGKVYLIQEDFWPLNTSLWVKEFRHSTPIFSYFLLRMFKLDRYNAGSAVATLNRNHIHNLPAIKPPRQLIERFEALAQPLFYRQKINQEESKTLGEIKDTLLPKLLSGQLRIQDAEKFVEQVA